MLRLLKMWNYYKILKKKKYKNDINDIINKERKRKRS